MTHEVRHKTRVDLRAYGFSPLSLRLWHGMALDAWLRAMRGNWHLVSPRRYPLIVTITLFGLFNQVLKWLSNVIYGRRLAKVVISPDPIFVIGHWRSGTTWLHRILMSDPRHGAPDVRACFRPETFLVGRTTFTPILRRVLAKKRPMDNVKLELESAEEDEHGICLSGALSPYRKLMFPNQESSIPEDPSDMTTDEAKHWRDKWLSFLQRVQFVNPGKRLVLKSPAHTMRTKEILRQFPNARFVHIVRDPYKVFLSTQESRRAMPAVNGLQDHLPTQAQQDAWTIARFVTFQRKFAADRKSIPDSQIITLRYEDLRADTMATMRQVYEHLALGDFSNIAAEIEKLVGAPQPYENNQYDLDAETRDLVDEKYADYFQRYGYLPMAQRPNAAS